MRGIYDHPLRAACETCRFAGSDGDFGEVETCDAPGDEGVDRQIDRWARGGEVGPCPGWRPSWWTDQHAVAEMERSMGLVAPVTP